MNFRFAKACLYSFIAILIAFSLLAGCSGNQTSGKKEEKSEAPKEETLITVRIGYQKNCPLVILKSRGTLEERLRKKGIAVEWKEFTAGPALLEALNAGSIDFGRTGDSPPIFAQAANAPFVYVAAGKSKFTGSAILVQENSPINSIADLKGKKVGFAKGSSSHYFTIMALEKSGLKYSDITPAFLQPGDGRVAFEKGNIDAWVVWDPFTASAEVNSKARILVNGEGYTSDRDYFLASTDFANKHSKVLDEIMEEVKSSLDWANSHHEELVKMMAPLLKIDEPSLELAINRRIYGVDELTPEIIKEQQTIADKFYELKIIPKKIIVEEAVKK